MSTCFVHRSRAASRSVPSNSRRQGPWAVLSTAPEAPWSTAAPRSRLVCTSSFRNPAAARDMDKTDKPEAYGVFKPVGHVIVSFPPEVGLQEPAAALAESGFAGAGVVQAPGSAVKAQADRDIQNAGVLATIGQELNLMKAIRDLAERGFNFIVVKASKDDECARVAEVALRFKAERAQKFGHLIIEELIPVGSDETQMSDTPERGLDAQTRSGVEGD